MLTSMCKTAQGKDLMMVTNLITMSTIQNTGAQNPCPETCSAAAQENQVSKKVVQALSTFLYKKGAECKTVVMRNLFLRKKEEWKTAEDCYKAKRRRTQEEGR